MIKLYGLDDKIPPLDVDASNEIVAQMPTYRRIFRMALGNARAKSGDEAVDCMKLALKLSTTENELMIEDAEFKLLKEKVAENSANLTALFHGSAYKRLNDVELNDEKR